MEITQRFFLSETVVLSPMAAIDEGQRRGFRHQLSDYALTRRRSRIPSRIISADAAALLGEFSEPTTIVDSVRRLAGRTSADPETILEQSFPLLEALIDSRILIAEGEPDGELEGLLQAGDQIAEWLVLTSLQSLEDTEVHQVRRGDAFGAMKLVRTTDRAVEMQLVREAAILRRLTPGLAPAVHDNGHDDAGRMYLVMEWCDGVHADHAAADLRRAGDRQGLLELCRRIVRAYECLHEAGVVHADVHPRNILVAADGSVRLIDFGWSRCDLLDGEYSRPARAAVPFFEEPELVQARRNGAVLPPASFLGEQYSVAAVLYALVTGAYYRNFSFEREELARQVAEEPPLPFSARGIEDWPDLEDLLLRGLAKAPELRFDSTSAFARSLDAVGLPAAQPPAIDRAGRSEIVAQFLDFARAHQPGNEKGSLPLSFNYGAAGVAYVLQRMAVLHSSPELLSLADLWISNALDAARDGDVGLPSGLRASEIGSVSPWHRESGLALVAALVAQVRGDERERGRAIQHFTRAVRAGEDRVDLTTGMAGALLAAAVLMETADAPDDSLKRVGDLLDGRLTTQALLSDRSLPFGLAHGWAGVLYALMRWRRAVGVSAGSEVAARLEMLEREMIPWGRGGRWPVGLAIGESFVTMAGWCNGSAGLVHFWLLAGDVFDEPRYQAVAERAAWNTWEASSGDATLCCGLTGRAYALLEMHARSGDRRWLHRADALAARAVAAKSNLQAWPSSLWKGLPGLALLLDELDVPVSMGMPLFGRCG